MQHQLISGQLDTHKGSSNVIPKFSAEDGILREFSLLDSVLENRRTAGFCLWQSHSAIVSPRWSQKSTEAITFSEQKALDTNVSVVFCDNRLLSFYQAEGIVNITLAYTLPHSWQESDRLISIYQTVGMPLINTFRAFGIGNVVLIPPSKSKPELSQCILVNGCPFGTFTIKYHESISGQIVVTLHGAFLLNPTLQDRSLFVSLLDSQLATESNEYVCVREQFDTEGKMNLDAQFIENLQCNLEIAMCGLVAANSKCAAISDQYAKYLIHKTE
jgi:hypothetical protein